MNRKSEQPNKKERANVPWILNKLTEIAEATPEDPTDPDTGKPIIIDDPKYLTKDEDPYKHFRRGPIKNKTIQSTAKIPIITNSLTKPPSNMEKQSKKKPFTPLSEKALKTATIKQLLDSGYDITSPEVITANKRDIIKLEASIKAKQEKIKSRVPPKTLVGAPAPSDAGEAVGTTTIEPIHNEEPVSIEPSNEEKKEDTIPEVVPEPAPSPIEEVKLPETEKEAIVSPEQKDIPVSQLERLESDFIAKREVYIKELNKYNKERSAFRNSIRRFGQWLGVTSEEKHLAEKYPNLVAMKTAYDNARMGYADTAITEKTATLQKENPNITQEALTQSLNEYREGIINKRIHHDEYSELTNMQAEKLPPNRKQIYDKLAGAYGWYAKGKGFGAITKRAIISTAVFGTVGVSFGAAAAMGTGAYLGYRLTKGVISATISGAVVKVIKNYQEKGMKKFTDTQASTKEKALSDFNAGRLTLVQYENKLKEIEKSIEKKNRNQLLARAGAGLLVGFGTSYGIQAAGGQTLYEDAYRSIKGGVPTEGTPVNHPHAEGTPIDKKPGIISSPEKPAQISDYAKVHATEGITHALKAQLENNTELAQKLGYPLSGTAMEKAHFLMGMAKAHGYIDGTGEIRVGEIGTAYVLNEDGSITEYAANSTTPIETHASSGTNNDLSGGNEKYEYHYPASAHEAPDATNGKESLIEVKGKTPPPFGIDQNDTPFDISKKPDFGPDHTTTNTDGHTSGTINTEQATGTSNINTGEEMTSTQSAHFTEQDGGSFVLRNPKNPLNEEIFNAKQRLQGYHPHNKYYDPNRVKWSKHTPGTEPEIHNKNTTTQTTKEVQTGKTPTPENIEIHKHSVIDKIFGHDKRGHHVHGEDSKEWKEMQKMTMDKIMNAEKGDFPKFERDEVSDLKWLVRQTGIKITDANGKLLTVKALTEELAKLEATGKINVAALLAKEH